MRVFAVLLAVVTLSMAGAASAAAHAGFVSSDPPNGTLLTNQPSQVILTFNEDLLETMVNVSIIDANDAVISTSIAEAAGPVVIVGWPPEATDGRYRLAYRVVSADGHPVTGDIELTIDATATPEQVSAAEQRATQSQAAIPGWVLIVGIGVFSAVAVALFTLALRRKSV